MSDLVVFSHLRWTFVWQRPQHLISRLARSRRTWFIEEPVAAGVPEPVLRTEEHGSVTRVWLEVPGTEAHVGFGGAEDGANERALRDLLGAQDGRPGDGRAGDERIVWLYTPLA